MIMTVACFGAGIGLAFNFLDFAWEAITDVQERFGIPRAKILALGALGGAVVISAEFWVIVLLMSPNA